VALAARAHGLPLYVAAPCSTIDPRTPDGGAIEIEERPADEVVAFGALRVAPEGADALNPAFDVTPAEYVAAIITERDVLRAPFGAGIADLLEADAAVVR
jgi:methylthioribose-1-phosphate isomerase